MYLLKIYSVILVSTLIIVACSKDKAKTPEQNNLINNNGSTVNCDTITFKYNATVKAIITNNCAGCHSAGSPNGNLTNYNTLKAYAQSGSLIGSLNGQGYTQMPPSGKLSNCDIKGIQNWVTSGANND